MVHKRLKNSDIPRKGFIPNRKYKIFFEDSQIQKKFEKLNEHRCSKCNLLERNLKALQQHLSKTHTLFFCALCLEHLKIFPSERKPYTRQELALHRRQGDKDDTSYKGHPLCRFCDERYMDNDELFKHLRKDHYYCHFCESDGSQDYYSDYADLKDHFKAKHYLCEEGDCANTQFTHAFRSRIDFQAHQANSHSRLMSKTQAKQARTIEVDIQLAPRNRRRDKGIVTADDYEEVKAPRSGAQGRGQGRSVKERFRDEDMNRAIQASLSVMSEEKMKKTKPVEEEEERKTPSPDLLQDTEHFPTLGKMKEEGKTVLRSDSPANVDSDSEKSSRSLAQRLAKNSNQSVQHGAMAEEDFPSLLNFVKPSQPEAKANPLKASKPLQNASKPIQNTYIDVSKSRPAADDFPSLPSSKANRASSGPSNMWGKKTNPVGKSTNITNSVSSRLPMEVIMNDGSANQSEIKKEKPRTTRNQTFNSENDFPTLSTGVDNRNTNWLKNVMDSSKKKVKSESPIDWFEVTNDQDEFKIENFSGDKDNKQLISETFKETKKKKKINKKGKSGNDNKSGSDVSSGTASLDNIATSLLGTLSIEPEKKKVQKTEKKVPIKEDVHVVTESDKSRQNQFTSNSNDKLVSSVKEEALEEKEFIPVKTTENRFDKLNHVEESDFPALEQKVEKGFLPVKAKGKKNTKLDSSDFPALSAPVKGPPPGFVKTKSKPPPGFDTSQTLSSGPLSPPPGFAVMKDLSLKNLMDTVSNGNDDFSYATKTESYHYKEPEDFQSRNKALVMKIKEVFQGNDDKFSKFKSCSSDFRGGNLPALDYYNTCRELIGTANFKEIFSELLVLLPDIKKQQELLTAHNTSEKLRPGAEIVLNISGKGSTAPWKSPNFVPCPTCSQILLQEDLNQHASSHAVDTDYPTLSSQVTSSHGPGLRAWIKAS